MPEPADHKEFLSFNSMVSFFSRLFSLQPFFTERVFQIFDKDNSGSISLQEFIDAIQQFSGQSADDKIRFLFKVYDIDGNVFILFNVPLQF